MTFGEPRFLWVLLLLPAVILFWRWVDNRRQAALARVGDVGLVQRLSATVNWRGRAWQTRLWFLALALVIVALARPQWGSEVQVVEQQGIQVMVALDVSHSMLAEDLRPNRLTRAKQEVDELMSRLDGDEVGLVLFSGASFIQFPLTSDYATARAFLENAHPGLISRPGTVIGDAIRTAMSGFDQERASQKVIVIMTDGEDHETDPVAAAGEAAENGSIIYTIGFGSPEGEPIPEFDEQGQRVGYKQDQQGNVVLSRLDETALQQIAQAGNGRYFRATAGGDELDALLRELDSLQAAQLESRFETRQVERFQLFLLGAVVCLLLFEMIPERLRQPRTRQTVQPAPTD